MPIQWNENSSFETVHMEVLHFIHPFLSIHHMDKMFLENRPHGTPCADSFELTGSCFENAGFPGSST